MNNNIFNDIPENLPEEFSEQLISSTNVKIERIVSRGHYSPRNFWYDQSENEWVIILQGEAMLAFENEKVLLKKGDYINIPAHKKHRVEWTTPEQDTLWLAVFY